MTPSELLSAAADRIRDRETDLVAEVALPHVEAWLREVAKVYEQAERKAAWKDYRRFDPSAFVGDDDRAALALAKLIVPELTMEDA